MRRGTKFLLLSDGTLTFALAFITPIYAIFVEEIGGDILDASWAYFAFMITSGIVMLIISHLENDMKRKGNFVVLGSALASVGALSYLFVDAPWKLMITQVILGVALAIQIPAADTLYAHYVDRKNETSEWGDWEAMDYIVIAIGGLVGGYIADIFGFKVLFGAMFVISVLGTAVSINLLRSKKYLRAS